MRLVYKQGDQTTSLYKPKLDSLLEMWLTPVVQGSDSIKGHDSAIILLTQPYVIMVSNERRLYLSSKIVVSDAEKIDTRSA